MTLLFLMQIRQIPTIAGHRHTNTCNSSSSDYDDDDDDDDDIKILERGVVSVQRYITLFTAQF